MVVSIDKATALKMHDKVRKHWAAELEQVKKELARYDLAPDQKDELLDRLQVLQTTDMALIVSPGQNEIEQMKRHGLDIVPHRKRMNESQPPLDEKFKDSEDPLRLVFLCAMWLTGFDVKCLATLYLDKPMKGHTLMQAIARVNRVSGGKKNGLIIDYNGMLKSLRQALATFAQGDGKGIDQDLLRDRPGPLTGRADRRDAARRQAGFVQVTLPPLPSTTMWALVPRIFSFRSSSKPVITARTMIRAATPRATPAVEIRVMMEMKVDFRLAFR